MASNTSGKNSVRRYLVWDGELGRTTQQHLTEGGVLPTIPTLTKGEACSECRRKKKRCDGARPACSRCAKSRAGAGCIYEVASNPISILGETAEPMRLSPPSQSVGLPESAPALPSDSRSKGLSLDVSDFEDPFSSDISTMPREKVTLRFRIATFSHQYKLGILGNCTKEQAIILGDRSGTFVHPIYIDFAQLYGCRTYRLISEMDVCDMFYCAQIYLIVGVYFLISSEITTATRYIKHAVEIIERSPDSFLPPFDDTSQTATPLGTSEEVQVQERFALVAHIVNCRSLLRIHVLERKIKTVHADVLNDLPATVAQGILDVLKGPPDGPLSSLDGIFTVEFWETSSIASNPLTIGATTMLLALRARSLSEKATSVPDWCNLAENFVRTLSLHLERISEILSRYIGLQDLGGCISIQGFNIIALVALAEIYLHLSRHPAFRQTEEAQNRCLAAMGHVIDAVKDLRNGNHLQKVHVYTRFSLCLAINVCSREMAVRHRLGPSDYPAFPHVCDLQGCLGVHVGLLTEAYQTLCGVTLPGQGPSR
ncbi:hypothetical protein BJ322DRAFT_416774 [Thelephora terrestris]|uniref:Zn(2)-C6 fungal-type domain-containing protein n=1 Tax=Thelephora terrestris TaxID=56493 RepID=A0A9P6HPG8_9AGAM|nr:hypothetical protein BJ322DRAFT_416774 [Thelephora terrestris]